jgi:hypothetical protein
VIEVDEGVGGPKTGLKLLTRNDFPRFLEQKTEDLEGLLLETDADTVAAKLA